MNERVIKPVLRKLVNSFSTSNHVVGILLCGSFADGSFDSNSDVDIWLYYSGIETQEQLSRLVGLTPSEYEIKNPHSGGYVLIEYVEADVLFSIKLHDASKLDQFISKYKLSFDEMLFEDLETFLKCKVLWQHGDFLSDRLQKVKQLFSVDLPKLTNILNRRYGDLVWRSAFQGIFRSDQFQWAGIMHATVNVMLISRALKLGIAPPPIKTRFSSFTLRLLGAESWAPELTNKINNAEDVPMALDIYRFVKSLETEFLASSVLSDRWWWQVFDIDALNIKPHPEVRGYIETFLESTIIPDS